MKLNTWPLAKLVEKLFGSVTSWTKIIGVEYETPQLFCDSSSAINWSEDPIQHQRTKHVELDYYYIREIVAEQKVKLYKIHTKENVSDLFTKNVDGKTFAYLKPFLMGWKQIKLEQ